MNPVNMNLETKRDVWRRLLAVLLFSICRGTRLSVFVRILAWSAILFVIVFAPRLTGVDAVIKKYARPPAEGPWELVDDTPEFWADIDVLDSASRNGDREALRALLTIGTFADGAVSEGMPDVHNVVQRHRPMAKEVIMEERRLKGRFAHWVE